MYIIITQSNPSCRYVGIDALIVGARVAGMDAQDRLPRMAKMRSIALICCNCVFALLSVRTVCAAESTPLPLPSDDSAVFAIGNGLWRVLLALLVIAGILLAIRWFVQRTNRASGQDASTGKSIQILERKVLGARQALLLVEVCGKKVLLHQSKGALVPLCEIEAEEGTKA
jgi:flagellar biogenesis protein FliO